MQDKKIVIKKIDTTKGYYLIYFCNYGHKLAVYFEKSEEDKVVRVNELILTHFIVNGDEKIMINDIIEELI